MTIVTGIDGDVFRRAAEIMREKGMCKGGLYTADGRVCLLESINVALCERGSVQDWCPYWEAAHVAVREFDPDSEVLYASVWNDLPDRTQTEVEKFLLFAADRADFRIG